MLVGRVMSVKRDPRRNVLVVDTGQNVLRNGRGWQFDVIFERPARRTIRMDLKGPLCYETDIVASGVPVPQGTVRGDLLAFLRCGAYSVATAFDWSGNYRRLFVRDGRRILEEHRR